VVAALPSAGVEVVEGVAAVLHAVEGGDGLLGAVEGAVPGEARLERGARGAAGGRDGGGGVLGEQQGQLGVRRGELAELHDCAPCAGFIYRAGEIRSNVRICLACNKDLEMIAVPLHDVCQRSGRAPRRMSLRSDTDTRTLGRV